MLVLGVRGTQVRNRARLDEIVLVPKPLGFEAPVFLEIEGAGAALAAAEIEDAESAEACSFYDLLIHEVIPGNRAGGRGPFAVIGKNFIAKIEAQHTRNRFCTVHDRAHFATLAEDLLQNPQILP